MQNIFNKYEIDKLVEVDQEETCEIFDNENIIEMVTNFNERAFN